MRKRKQTENEIPSHIDRSSPVSRSQRERICPVCKRSASKIVRVDVCGNLCLERGSKSSQVVRQVRSVVKRDDTHVHSSSNVDNALHSSQERLHSSSNIVGRIVPSGSGANGSRLIQNQHDIELTLLIEARVGKTLASRARRTSSRVVGQRVVCILRTTSRRTHLNRARAGNHDSIRITNRHQKVERSNNSGSSTNLQQSSLSDTGWQGARRERDVERANSIVHCHNTKIRDGNGRSRQRTNNRGRRNNSNRARRSDSRAALMCVFKRFFFFF